MFNTLLKELRAQNGLTQGQLAKAAGVSPGNVGDWESGKSKPGYNALASLARIFDVSADYLLELTPEKASGDTDELRRLNEFKEEQGLVCDGSPLDAEETDLVAMYRLLPSHVREDMFDQVFCLYRKYVERKRESIYWTYSEDRSAEKSGPAEGREARDGTA